MSAPEPTPVDQQHFVTVSTFARRLGFSPRTVRSWCQRGHLSATREQGYQGQWHIPVSTLEAWLQDAYPADVADNAETLPKDKSQ